MDFKAVSWGLGVLCVVLAAYALLGGATRTVYVNNTVYPKDNLTVYYLYPLRCIDCDLNKQGQCDYCTSYYRSEMMELLSQDLGVPVSFHISDVVSKPNALIVYNEKITLSDGRSRYNIANTLCRFAGVKKSCELFDGELKRVKECVSRYGVDEDTLVYHTNSKDCAVCSKTDEIVGKLIGLEYNDTMKYTAKMFDHSDPQGKKIFSDCLQSFDNTDYVPQLLCTGSGRDLTGEFTLKQATDFADLCIESG
ncbi:MAG: hypothetical protein V1744_05970 [Candidatus Altiarchaeota archaeon]